MNQSGLYFGIQLKYARERSGFRLTAEYYPDCEAGIFMNSSREVSVVGNNIQYLDINTQARMLRIGIGYERRRSRDWGTSYFGLDYNWNRHWKSILTTSYQVDVANNVKDSVQLARYGRLSGYGLGVAPFVGCEFPIVGGLGVSVEAKADIMFSITEGYGADDNGIIVKSGMAYYFRTFPLLNCRLYYSF